MQFQPMSCIYIYEGEEGKHKLVVSKKYVGVVDERHCAGVYFKYQCRAEGCGARSISLDYEMGHSAEIKRVGDCCYRVGYLESLLKCNNVQGFRG